MHGNLDTLALFVAMTGPVLVLLGLYVLWVFYLAVMNLHRAHQAGQLRPVAFVLGMPVLLVGLALDVLVNLVVFTVLLLELPRELLVTDRLQRLLREGSGWRVGVARWICSELLDTFDPGGHHCR